jgi:hypothetical protein
VTPFKAARKAPAAKKAPPKKVAVKVSKKAVAKKKLPQTLDWGKKVPKDHLSYLSKEEMKVLQKNRSFKGKRSFKGVPAFPDPVDTGYGDGGQGTKSSTGTTSSPSAKKSGNTSGVGGGGGGGGGASGSRGSSSGSVGAGNGANAGRSQGGQDSGSRGGYNSGTSGSRGGYNSGTSGSRNGGASTQSPGMGRNEGRVGPQSPMSGQGTSFATNKAARDDTLRRAYGIEDQRGLQNMPQQPNWDVGNPNLPAPDYDRWARDRLAERDAENREIAKNYGDDYMTPGEIRAQADRWKDSFNKSKVNQEQRSMGLDDIRSRMPDSAFTNAYKSNSDRTSDFKIGGPRSGTQGGFSGGGMGGTYRGGGWSSGEYSGRQGGQGWKAGGLVKNKSLKTFKKK